MVATRELHTTILPYESSSNKSQITDLAGTDLPEVETNSKAMKVTLQNCSFPFGFGSNCHALDVDFNGTNASGWTQAPILTLIWPSIEGVAVIRKWIVGLAVGGITTSQTAGIAKFELFRARNYYSLGGVISWSRFYGTGAGPEGKQLAQLRSRQVEASMNVYEYTNIPTTLATTTVTRDPSPMATLCGGVKATAGQICIPQSVLYETKPGEQPLVLTGNMGAEVLLTYPVFAAVQVHFNTSVYWDEYDTDEDPGFN